jgi:hypothetical protein
VEKMTGDHPRNTGPMLSSLRPWGQNAVGQALRVSGGKRKKALPNAWWCAGIGCSTRQQECAEARSLHARSHRGTPATKDFDATIAAVDPRYRVSAPSPTFARRFRPFATATLSMAVTAAAARSDTPPNAWCGLRFGQSAAMTQYVASCGMFLIALRLII